MVGICGLVEMCQAICGQLENRFGTFLSGKNSDKTAGNEVNSAWNIV